MRKNLITGLAILLPLALTYFIIDFAFEILTAPFIGIAKSLLEFLGFNPVLHPFVQLLVKLCILAVIFLSIMLIGLLARRFLMRFIIDQLENLLKHIPGVRAIFNASREITQSLFGTDAKPFKKTIITDFPLEGVKAMGFVTASDGPSEIESLLKQKGELQTVFIPTSPHPISGFLLIVRKDDTIDVNVSTENVFKFLVSCGLYDVSGEKLNQ